VPADADRVRLLVTNPGDTQAVVELQVVTADGAFVPLGSEQLSIDPGTVGSVDLTAALDGRAAAVRLRSEVPVIGTVRASRAGDVGYAGAAPPLEGPAGLVLVGERSVVQVVGGDEPATLQLSVLDTDGEELLRRAVTAPPSGLVLVPVPEAAAYAVLLPRGSTGAGSGYAAAVHVVPGVAVQGATPLPTTQLRTAVTPYTGQSAS
jgi:hypothetical protein